MAGGGFAAPANGAVFEAKITPIVIISCIMAATGGLMFGYDVGISGLFLASTLLLRTEYFGSDFVFTSLV